MIDAHRPRLYSSVPASSPTLMRAPTGARPPSAPRTWPQSVRAIVRMMLTSRYAMWMGWGPDLTFFYNDAYAR